MAKLYIDILHSEFIGTHDFHNKTNEWRRRRQRQRQFDLNLIPRIDPIQNGGMPLFYCCFTLFLAAYLCTLHYFACHLLFVRDSKMDIMKKGTKV